MFITIWMFGTSVLYPVSGVGGAAGLLLRLNPMTPIIDAYRDILFSNEWPLAPEFLVAAVISIAVFDGLAGVPPLRVRLRRECLTARAIAGP